MKSLLVLAMLFITADIFAIDRTRDYVCELKLGSGPYGKIGFSYNESRIGRIDLSSLKVEHYNSSWDVYANLPISDTYEGLESNITKDDKLAFSWGIEYFDVEFTVEYDDTDIYLRSNYISNGPVAVGYYLCQKSN